MSFTFYTDIPGANNNPSVDQPKMLTNNVTVESALNVDHITFNDADCGKHKQVTFISENAAGAQIDPASTLYTGAGSASTNAQLFYRNEDRIFMASPIRAFCTFSTVNVDTDPVTIANGFNISNIAATDSGATLTITLETGAVTGDDVLVYISNVLGSLFTYSFTNPNIVITGLTNNQRNNRITNIMVLQA